MESPGTITKKRGYFLPHWTRDGAIYHVVFRLRDSLPRAALLRIQEELGALKDQESAGALDSDEAKRLKHLVSRRVESYLDACHGSCALKQPRLAKVVAEALSKFDKERYVLHAWCVMPNHVHAVVQPLTGHSLASILHSWKSYTASEINRLTGGSGEFWQKESYDHLIRSEGAYQSVLDYVRSNPDRAGLKNWKWVGAAESTADREF